MPIFGEVLGLQVIALAFGGKTAKLKYGHRGGYPIKNLAVFPPNAKAIT